MTVFLRQENWFDHLNSIPINKGLKGLAMKRQLLGLSKAGYVCSFFRYKEELREKGDPLVRRLPIRMGSPSIQSFLVFGWIQPMEDRSSLFFRGMRLRENPLLQTGLIFLLFVPLEVTKNLWKLNFKAGGSLSQRSQYE